VRSAGSLGQPFPLARLVKRRHCHRGAEFYGFAETKIASKAISLYPACSIQTVNSVQDGPKSTNDEIFSATCIRIRQLLCFAAFDERKSI
jgi:hypothetical protein